jgi:hypothetical protein
MWTALPLLIAAWRQHVDDTHICCLVLTTVAHAMMRFPCCSCCRGINHNANNASATPPCCCCCYPLTAWKVMPALSSGL